MSTTMNSEVKITLDGKEYTLRPTLKVAEAISRALDGWNNAYKAIFSEKLEAFQVIVAAGLVEKMSGEDVRRSVYEAGTVKLATPLIEFVATLQNGGRKPEDARSDAEDEEDVGNGEL